MSIISEKLFTVQCDGCKTYSNDESGIGYWIDESEAKDEAMNNGWENEYGKDYCPKCYMSSTENMTKEVKKSSKSYDKAIIILALIAFFTVLYYSVSNFDPRDVIKDSDYVVKTVKYVGFSEGDFEYGTDKLIILSSKYYVVGDTIQISKKDE